MDNIDKRKCPNCGAKYIILVNNSKYHISVCENGEVIKQDKYLIFQIRFAPWHKLFIEHKLP